MIIFFPADKVHIASRHGLVSISAHAVTQPRYETEGEGKREAVGLRASVKQPVKRVSNPQGKRR